MKNVKRLIAIVMAIAMLFALSVTAFADNDTITINVYINGSQQPLIYQVNYVSGMTVKTALDNASFGPSVEWEAVLDYYDPDVTHYAATTILNYSTVPVGQASGVQAQAWSTVNPGYGLMSVDTQGGVIVGYNYVYAGKDWVYKVNGVTPGYYSYGYFIQYYMDEAVLSAGDVISLYYDLQISYWESDEPVLEYYPYI